MFNTRNGKRNDPKVLLDITLSLLCMPFSEYEIGIKIERAVLRLARHVTIEKQHVFPRKRCLENDL